MKRFYFLAVLFTFLLTFFSFHGVDAQTAPSISGDDVCGATSACQISDLKKIVTETFKLLIALGLPVLVVFVIYRFVVAWYQVANGNANAYHEALKKAGNAIVGFFIIVVIFGGALYFLLSFFGVKEDPLKLLKVMLTDAFIPHAYAVSGQYLPNTTNITSLYDFLLQALRLIMRFFIYPALIVMWVWTGFNFVYAQGKPELLTKAKKLLFWAFLSTFIVFITQGFLIALQNTVKQIVPSQSGGAIQNSQTVTDPTASVTTQGTRSDGASYCAGKAIGTQCSISSAGVTGGYVAGTCSSNEDGVFGCYVATTGDVCITSDANGAQVTGTMNGTGQCIPQGAR
ncbi:MAG: hypothetical protein RLZZ308_633 [Candidatus Parcubacteria bacterium]|jgi:hypothetical protein